MFAEFLETHDLATLLAPREACIVVPPASDRNAWQGLEAESRALIHLAAEERHGKPYPPLTATQFLAFCRSGSREEYEKPYFARRHQLMAAVLGECVLLDGRYLDDIINGLWCICEESFWGVSAHNGSDHPGARPSRERPLPDIENPYIDLFAAQTAALLSFSCHLLGDSLRSVTPLIVRRVKLEVERRIIAPFFHHDDFWWMGMIRSDVNNWTPWILSNVMAVLLLWETDKHRLADGLARAMRMLDSYLAIIPPDGGCDEGASYWNVAGGALLDCLELLWTATGGRASFYEEPLIQRIGEFPLHAHIAGPYYWNFADCDAMPKLDGEAVYRYGLRIQNEELAILGARTLQETPSIFPGDTPEFSRVLNRLFHPVPTAPVALKPPADVTLPHLQIWARERAGIYAAIKGGHNGENHNHNDVGSFLLYVDGKPAVIDLGNMTYTAKTFGPERYTLCNTRSCNHNLPVIGGVEQAAGRAYAAGGFVCQQTSVSLEISGAYPAEAGILRLERRAEISQASFVLTDDLQLRESRPVTWVFMLREKPEIAIGLAHNDQITLWFDEGLQPLLEEFPVTDPRMMKNFPGSIWRLTLTAQEAAVHKQSFTFTRSSAARHSQPEINRRKRNENE